MLVGSSTTGVLEGITVGLAVGAAVGSAVGGTTVVGIEVLVGANVGGIGVWLAVKVLLGCGVDVITAVGAT